MPDMPGGLFPSKPMLEFDTTSKNIFVTNLSEEKFSILDQVKKSMAEKMILKEVIMNHKKF